MVMTAQAKNNIIKQIRSECKKYNIRFYLSKGKYVISRGQKCGGYFYPSERILCGTKHVITTLVHEYCHMQQWIEQCDIFKKCDGTFDLICEWLNGKQFPDKQINKALNLQSLLELDCDKRATKFLRKMEYFNVSRYIQKSNLYSLLFYGMNDMKINVYTFWNRKDISKIFDLMPKTFNYNRDKQLDKIKKYVKQNPLT